MALPLIGAEACLQAAECIGFLASTRTLTQFRWGHVHVVGVARQ